VFTDVFLRAFLKRPLLRWFAPLPC
jgi:hypothetical protein